MKEPTPIGEQIKVARTAAGLSQEQLAAKSFVSTYTIAALEQKKALDCSTYIIRNLQKALNIKFEL